MNKKQNPLTLKSRRIPIEQNPRTASFVLISFSFVNTVVSVATKLDPPPPVSPKSPFNCDTPMITAVAEVNPTVTGSEIRSTRAPNRRKAIRHSTMPEKKHKRIAK